MLTVNLNVGPIPWICADSFSGSEACVETGIKAESIVFMYSRAVFNRSKYKSCDNSEKNDVLCRVNLVLKGRKVGGELNEWENGGKED